MILEVLTVLMENAKGMFGKRLILTHVASKDCKY
jgi:hypothetical protein